MTPKVTVLMPVYNGEKHIETAIESILGQTFSDFEFLIIDDGSTDRSAEMIRSYSDDRIRLVQNERNLGLIETLNKGIDISRGKYIARMDCDDISLPARLEKQVLFMKEHSHVGICGTWVRAIENSIEKIFDYPTDPQKIQSQLLFDSPLAHPSVIIRRSLLDKFHLRYDPQYLYAEDWQLWQRCSFHFLLGNVPEVLLEYHIYPDSISRSNERTQLETIQRIDNLNFKALGLAATPEEAHIHRELGFERYSKDITFIERSAAWLNKLQTANKNRSIYPEPAFSQTLAERLFTACSNATKQGFQTWNIFQRSPLSGDTDLPFMKKFKFAVKCAIKWSIH